MRSVGAIVLCRLDSQRLPGKALLKVAGRPLLDFAIARCRQVSDLVGNIVLATTQRTVDDPLADFAKEVGISLFRGATDDVAGRVRDCTRHFSFHYFVRVNGDSPLLHPALIDEAIQRIEGDRLDFVTNIFPRSFPYGVSVEVVRSQPFSDACDRMSRPEHREHVTKYLYENCHQYRYANLTCPLGDQSKVRMTVDTPDDLVWFGRLASHFGVETDRVSYIDALRFLTQGV